MYKLILLLLKTQTALCIWPPSYKVNMSHQDTFVISETIENKEFKDVYEEDEMINAQEMETKLKTDNDKFYRLHADLANIRNNNNDNVLNGKKTKIFEFNPEKEENYVKEDDIVYFENSENQSLSSKKKRSDSNGNNSVNYDYESLKAEFKNEVKDAIRSNETLNYTTVREDEGIKDSIKSLMGQKVTRNCTEEERKGIGVVALKCIWDDINKPKLGTRWLDRILRIILIWICVYIIIAVPCWCQYGWCCCCCRCKFCKPLEQIEDAKQFFAQNPPGTFHDKDGNVIYYTPTLYEKYAQRKLEDQLQNM
ncbi:uncharacterized protein [Diabrotica undecimpunctata]|uniref:uncharacterized protein n=1 Tax=Diabrotica undecimpunctata TaxID=50387 RepID=UPI003B637404